MSNINLGYHGHNPGAQTMESFEDLNHFDEVLLPHDHRKRSTQSQDCVHDSPARKRSRLLWMREQLLPCSRLRPGIRGNLFQTTQNLWKSKTKTVELNRLWAPSVTHCDVLRLSFYHFSYVYDMQSKQTKSVVSSHASSEFLWLLRERSEDGWTVLYDGCGLKCGDVCACVYVHTPVYSQTSWAFLAGIKWVTKILCLWVYMILHSSVKEHGHCCGRLVLFFVVYVDRNLKGIHCINFVPKYGIRFVILGLIESHTF